MSHHLDTPLAARNCQRYLDVHNPASLTPAVSGHLRAGNFPYVVAA